MADTTTLTVTYTYESWEIPPRARKPRPVRREATITVDVPTVTADQAPVVMRVPESAWSKDPRMAELRGYAGRLFQPLTAEHVFDHWPLEAPSVAAGSHLFPLERRSDHGSRSQATAEAEVRAELGKFLVVDGMVWLETDEPAYEISTTGMGGEHGGTHLDLRRYPRNDLMTHPATDRDAAVEHAVTVAEDRGSTHSLTSLRATNAVQVLDPAYVRTPHRADVLAEKEATVLALVEQAKATLADTDRTLYQRVADAQSLLEDARREAWLL